MDAQLVVSIFELLIEAFMKSAKLINSIISGPDRLDSAKRIVS